jgi:predicted Fe-S protein YdhL (DUF1289 family)
MRRQKHNSSSYITPCIKICHIENDKCIGCKRTTEELSNWFWMEDHQKLQVMKQLKSR